MIANAAMDAFHKTGRLIGSERSRFVLSLAAQKLLERTTDAPAFRVHPDRARPPRKVNKTAKS
jgi:hypothetical protein